MVDVKPGTRRIIGVLGSDGCEWSDRRRETHLCSAPACQWVAASQEALSVDLSLCVGY